MYESHSFFPPKLKVGGGRGIVFENWTKRGVMKKLLKNSGLVEMGGGTFRKGEGFSNCFINFP